MLDKIKAKIDKSKEFLLQDYLDDYSIEEELKELTISILKAQVVEIEKERLGEGYKYEDGYNDALTDLINKNKALIKELN